MINYKLDYNNVALEKAGNLIYAIKKQFNEKEKRNLEDILDSFELAKYADGDELIVYLHKYFEGKDSWKDEFLIEFIKQACPFIKYFKSINSEFDKGTLKNRGIIDVALVWQYLITFYYLTIRGELIETHYLEEAVNFEWRVEITNAFINVRNIREQK